MNIEMGLKLKSYILDLDHVKLSLGIFFLLGCLLERLFHKLSKTQKHTPKSRKFNVFHNFTCGNGSLVVPWSAIYLDTCPL